tara:strand:- start:112 stop:774 length:663 start_codon:yes stop_codon:yes gene_type:complete
LDTAAVREAVLEHMRLEELSQQRAATQMYSNNSNLSYWLRDEFPGSFAPANIALARTVEHAARVWLSKRMPQRRDAASSGAPARKRPARTDDEKAARKRRESGSLEPTKNHAPRGASTVRQRAGIGSERWAMCDLCRKWRRLYAPGKLPEHWYRSTVESSLAAFHLGRPPLQRPPACSGPPSGPEKRAQMRAEMPKLGCGGALALAKQSSTSLPLAVQVL